MPSARTLLLLFLFCACRQPPIAHAFKDSSDIGVAVVHSGSPCLVIGNAGLSSSERIRLIVSVPTYSTADAEITGRAAHPCTAAEQSEGKLSHYGFKLTQESLPPEVPAFAIIGFRGALKTSESGITADLDGNGHPVTFRSCTSAEGVHLTIWSGKPLESSRRWHRYFYLGYDVDPTCTEADTKSGGT